MPPTEAVHQPKRMRSPKPHPASANRITCAAAPPTATRTPRRFRVGKRHFSWWPGRAHVGMPRHPRRTNTGPVAGPPGRFGRRRTLAHLLLTTCSKRQATGLALAKDLGSGRYGHPAAAPSHERCRRGTELSTIGLPLRWARNFYEVPWASPRSAGSVKTRKSRRRAGRTPGSRSRSSATRSSPSDGSRPAGCRAARSSHDCRPHDRFCWGHGLVG